MPKILKLTDVNIKWLLYMQCLKQYHLFSKTCSPSITILGMIEPPPLPNAKEEFFWFRVSIMVFNTSPRTGFKRTTLVLLGTDCTGSVHLTSMRSQ